MWRRKGGKGERREEEREEEGRGERGEERGRVFCCEMVRESRIGFGEKFLGVNFLSWS